MATVLFLNNTQVFPDGTQSIKVTRENPYMTSAGSYTLDVVLPMDILVNRRFFGNANRMERSKNFAPMKCRLLVGNHLVLSGSAKVTQVTENQVKVQLLGGRSEVNFLAEDNGDYIDELPLWLEPTLMELAADPTLADNRKVRSRFSYIHDETSGYTGQFQHFCLIDIAKEIIAYYGFTVTSCSVVVEPWNQIYVANAKNTRHAEHTLPHWTPREFFTEFCNFFNVTLDIDESAETVAIVDTPTFFSGRRNRELSPVDEYTAEVSDDGHALAADNLSFDLSSSEGHDYDCISDSIRLFGAVREYESYSEALSAYNAMNETERKLYIFKCPMGKFAGWDHDFSDWGDEQPHPAFTQIDVLAPLTRAHDASETKLKICPVAIIMGEYGGFFGSQSSDGHSIIYRQFMPSLENPTGIERGYNTARSNGSFGGSNSQSGNSDSEDTTPIQDLIEGNSEIDGQAEKEDRLQVMFIDDIEQTYSRWDSSRPNEYIELPGITGFTDWQYKKSHRGNEHRHWSLSLNPTNADSYLGQLHVNGFSFNMKVKHIFKFVEERMPDPRDIFIIRGKKYGCEKIEANVNGEGFNKLMTGYFYEML